VTYGVKVLQVRHDDRGGSACMRAENLAEVAEFFSFGTNT